MATSEGRSCNPDMPDRSCDFNKSLELYRFAAAVALLGCGGVYLLGGALCFGLLKRGPPARFLPLCDALPAEDKDSAARFADYCWLCAGADSADAHLLAARSNRNRMRSQAEADLAELEKKREELHGLLGRRD